MELLLDLRASLDALADEGATALHCAVRAGRGATVELLVGRRADLGATTTEGAGRRGVVWAEATRPWTWLGTRRSRRSCAGRWRQGLAFRALWQAGPEGRRAGSGAVCSPELCGARRGCFVDRKRCERSPVVRNPRVEQSLGAHRPFAEAKASWTPRRGAYSKLWSTSFSRIRSASRHRTVTAGDLRNVWGMAVGEV